MCGLATASADLTARLWTTGGRLLQTLQGHTGRHVLPLLCPSFAQQQAYGSTASCPGYSFRRLDRPALDHRRATASNAAGAHRQAHASTTPFPPTCQQAYGFISSSSPLQTGRGLLPPPLALLFTPAGIWLHCLFPSVTLRQAYGNIASFPLCTGASLWFHRLFPSFTPAGMWFHTRFLSCARRQTYELNDSSIDQASVCFVLNSKQGGIHSMTLHAGAG